MMLQKQFKYLNNFKALAARCLDMLWKNCTKLLEELF